MKGTRERASEGKNGNGRKKKSHYHLVSGKGLKDENTYHIILLSTSTKYWERIGILFFPLAVLFIEKPTPIISSRRIQLIPLSLSRRRPLTQLLFSSVWLIIIGWSISPYTFLRPLSHLGIVRPSKKSSRLQWYTFLGSHDAMRRTKESMRPFIYRARLFCGRNKRKMMITRLNLSEFSVSRSIHVLHNKVCLEEGAH